MRTTIDLPPDLHRATLQIARDRGQTLSRIVTDLLRLALTGGSNDAHVDIDEETGLPVVRVGGRVTVDDVHSVEDER